jgi:hypothetical protein
MPESRASFTRATGTRIDIGDDGIVTLTYRSGHADLVRVTPIADFLREWRQAGVAIADWEDRQAAKIRAFPQRPRPCGVVAAVESERDH